MPAMFIFSLGGICPERATALRGTIVNIPTVAALAARKPRLVVVFRSFILQTPQGSSRLEDNHCAMQKQRTS
jgi:hypothetical protein